MNDNDNPSSPDDPALPDPYGAPDRDDADRNATYESGSEQDTVITASAASDAGSDTHSVTDTASETEPAGTGSGVAVDSAHEDEIDGLIDPSLTDDDFDKFVNDDSPGGFEDVLSRPTTRVPPPPFAQPPRQRKLVRDPYSRLGGVSSGLAHYFGLDVTLVRFAVLVGSLITGIGFLVYFIAWAVIPRATMWPPVGQLPGDPQTNVSNRNMAVGLVVLGLVIFLGLSGGPGEIIVPLVLVAGGVALLRKSPAPSQVPAAGPASVPSAAAASMGASAMAPPPGSATWEPVVSQPVAPRSRTRRAARVLVLAPLVLLPLAAIAGIAALVFVADEGDFRFDEGGFSIDEGFAGDDVIVPSTAASLQADYIRDAGSIQLDLRSLDDSMFTEPFDVDVQLDIGEIKVFVPEDLSVEVQATSNLGDLSVFESNTDGINRKLQAADADAMVRLDLDVDVGEITVVRSS